MNSTFDPTQTSWSSSAQNPAHFPTAAAEIAEPYATAATLLQAGGISQGVAMKLVGHNSESIHEVYIRPNDELLRAAAAVLPDFH